MVIGPEPRPRSPPLRLPTRGLPPRVGIVGIRARRLETSFVCVDLNFFHRIEALRDKSSSSGRTYSCWSARVWSTDAIPIGSLLGGNYAVVAPFQRAAVSWRCSGLW